MKPATLVTCVFLLLVALAHVLRVVFAVPVTVGGYAVPMWMSTVAVLFLAVLSVWLWRDQRARPGREHAAQAPAAAQ
jgi:membrane protein implicated in regulation of membrane protease activity